MEYNLNVSNGIFIISFFFPFQHVGVSTARLWNRIYIILLYHETFFSLDHWCDPHYYQILYRLMIGQRCLRFVM